MKKLNVKWKRLVTNGETCPRCNTTGKEIEKAVTDLRKALTPLEVKVIFEKEEITKKDFENDPLKSNMIFLNNRSLEYWLDGEVGKSECCDVCGSNDCRTTIINGKTYEEIPVELIVKAGLIAASEIVNNKTEESCCSQSNSCKC